MPITFSKAGDILEREFRQQYTGSYIYIGLGYGQAPNKYGYYQEVSFVDTNYTRVPVSLVGGGSGVTYVSGWQPYGMIKSGPSYGIITNNDIVFGGQYGANANWSTPGAPDTYVRYVLFFSSELPTTNDLLFWGYLYDGTGNFSEGNRIATGNIITGRNFNIPRGSLELHLQNDYS